MFDKLRLLVVDNDEFDFKVLKRHLESIRVTDYQLVWAETVEDARIALAQQDFDAALIDYRLDASVSGIEFVRELGGREAAFPILMLTGFSDGEIDADALLAGAFDYLDKATLTRELLDRAVRFAITSHQNEQMLRASFREAAEQAEINRRILSIVSHEMKSPVGAIKEYSDHILRKCDGKTCEAGVEAAERIKSASIHMEDFLRNLSEFVRLNNSAAKPSVKDFHLKTMLLETIDYFRPFAEHKCLKLVVDVDASTNALFSGDRLRIRHILINLIKNAIKYSDEGTITVAARVDGGRFTASVRDEGVGMPPEQALLCAAGETGANRPGSEASGGLGIGLSICHSLINLLGGTMTLESRVGVGTTAAFELPLSYAQDVKVA